VNRIEVQQLLDKIIDGDQNAFNKLVITYKDYAFTIAYNVLGNREEAEEIAHDSFIKAYKNLKKFNRTAKFSTWLYRIVFNTAVSEKRKKKIHKDPIEDHMYLPEDNRDQLEDQDKKYFLNEGLKNLLDEDRIVLTLFYLDDMSLEEISQVVDMKVNSIKVRLHRARKRLARELEKKLKHEALNL